MILHKHTVVYLLHNKPQVETLVVFSSTAEKSSRSFAQKKKELLQHQKYASKLQRK